MKKKMKMKNNNTSRHSYSKSKNYERKPLMITSPSKAAKKMSITFGTIFGGVALISLLLLNFDFFALALFLAIIFCVVIPVELRAMKMVLFKDGIQVKRGLFSRSVYYGFPEIDRIDYYPGMFFYVHLKNNKLPCKWPFWSDNFEHFVSEMRVEFRKAEKR